MRFPMTEHEKCDLLIQVAANRGDCMCRVDQMAKYFLYYDQTYCVHHFNDKYIVCFHYIRFQIGMYFSSLFVPCIVEYMS